MSFWPFLEFSGEKPTQLEAARSLLQCNVTNFNIFFLGRKLKCKSSKSYAYGLPSSPQQLREHR